VLIGATNIFELDFLEPVIRGSPLTRHSLAPALSHPYPVLLRRWKDQRHAQSGLHVAD
jgi:hypothetical protein